MANPRRPACRLYLGLGSSFHPRLRVHPSSTFRPCPHLASSLFDLSPIHLFRLQFPSTETRVLPFVLLCASPCDPSPRSTFPSRPSSLVVSTGRTAAEHRQKSLVETAESRQKFSSKHAPLFRPSAAKGDYRHPNHRLAIAPASPREGARALREQRGGCVPAAVLSGFLWRTRRLFSPLHNEKTIQ